MKEVSGTKVATLVAAVVVACVAVKVGKSLNYKRQLRIHDGQVAADVMRCMADLDACEEIIIAAAQCSTPRSRAQ